jgi:hypothetical protein
MRHLEKLVLPMVLLACGLYGADFETCPANVDVQPQQLAKVAPGWTASNVAASQAGGRNHALWFVKVFEGAPKEKADLVPDVNDRLKRSWTFVPSPGGFWLECHYTRTTVVLSRQLPAGIKSCTVTFTPDVSLDGQQQIKQLLCR